MAKFIALKQIALPIMLILIQLKPNLKIALDLYPNGVYNIIKLGATNAVIDLY